jgi:trehalose 6-phosphate phosphatase
MFGTPGRPDSGLERPLLDALQLQGAMRPRRLLVLDYDGALAPLRTDRTQARPSAAVLDALSDAQHSPGTTVAVLSGRPVSELRRLVDGVPVHLVGEHGWEEWSPAGGRVEHEVEPLVSGQLARAASLVYGTGDLVERKRCSVVLHTRGMDPARAAAAQQAAEALWRPLALPPLLRLERIHAGLELRAGSRDKGVAAREIIGRQAADTFVLALGDDTADEAVLREADGRGLAVRVGEGATATTGRWRIPTIEGVAEFLRAFCRVIRADGTGA